MIKRYTESSDENRLRQKCIKIRRVFCQCLEQSKSVRTDEDLWLQKIVLSFTSQVVMAITQVEEKQTICERFTTSVRSLITNLIMTFVSFGMLLSEKSLSTELAKGGGTDISYLRFLLFQIFLFSVINSLLPCCIYVPNYGICGDIFLVSTSHP